MTENPQKYQSKSFNTDGINAANKNQEPVEQVLKTVNICAYGLMIMACLFLIMWLIFV